MTDAQAAEAGRALSRVRWGSTRAERLVTELESRRDQLQPGLRARLADLAATPTEEDA
jgi:hypothetical protein